jgi:hypothetical protein
VLQATNRPPSEGVALLQRFRAQNEQAAQHWNTEARLADQTAYQRQRDADKDRVDAQERELRHQDRLRAIEKEQQALLQQGRDNEAKAKGVEFEREKFKFAQADTLRDEATKITETFRPMQEAYERIGEAAKAGNALGDLGLIYTYTRLLDPATVHEEEIKRGMKAGGLGEYISGWSDRVTKGELLTPKVRQDFVEMARKFYDVRKKGYDKELGKYRALAEKFGLDPDTVAVSLARDQGPPPGLTVVIP